MRNSKRALFTSIVSLLLCFAMLVGTTFAWFTDSVTSSGNIIKSGNLDAMMYWTDDISPESGEVDWKDASKGSIFDYQLWEPGYSQLKYVKIENAGNLAFKYQLNVIPNVASSGNEVDLADVIDVYFGVVDDNFAEPTAFSENMSGLTKVGTLSELMTDPDGAASGILLPENGVGTLPAGVTAENGSVTACIILHMQESAGNEYQDISVGGGFSVQLLATQYTYENDTFGNTYDENAQYPEVEVSTNVNVNVSAEVDPTDEDKVPEGGITIGEATEVNASVPEGVQLDPDTTELTLTVKTVEESESNITLKDTEVLSAVDVHIEGVSKDNTTAITVHLGAILPKGLNWGNATLYHVENAVTNAMTQVSSLAELDAHNEFYYDPATGKVTVAMATFSEITAVADTENAWNGDVDTSWYNTTDTSFVIANADQLAGFGQIVGGMAQGITQDSFVGKTVKLISNINLGDAEDSNKEALIFYPIGYYFTTDKNGDGTNVVYSTVNSFEGTFDGNGHTIANFYQNTWEMDGDYNSGYPAGSNHYNDAMGLFGYVKTGTVKNLTVDNFSSDGEFTPTGVIAAYAVNSTFENIAITNCNPRVYNTGNGGIVGIGGNSDDPDTYKLTFTNITIDNSNKITALWGSWDVACGGLVGMFRGAGHVYMTDCHVAAQMDVYNDVCGNYQYYWYRYAGMMVGTNYNMTEKDGYTVPETDKFHAENCTVHFGEWNDYYYCELVANSLASYTHDHQFSRLTEIESLDEIKSGDTWIKTGNFLLISGDTKTCYHIVNKNGTLTQHLHADAGEETVNGKTVLKEDKQIVYLPFNQLFTGYGWGVKHIPVYNGEDYAFEGITILDRDVADSVTKFSKANTAKDTYTTGTTVTIGELFEDTGSSVDINLDNVQVTVSPVGETSTAGGTYTANASDWTQGTLTFSGLGVAAITITDYYFCTPTTITVIVGEPNSVDKFTVKFTNTDDYLYRVGNANTVSLGSLFDAIEGVEIGNVTATVTSLDENTNVAGTFTANSDWRSATIKFSGTGPVLVTIDDDNYANELTLMLEVVDATNVTSYSGLGNKNSVLLSDITMSSGESYYLSSGATLYGNGFTFDVTDGAYSGTGSITNNYVVCLTNANLDNVKIVGAVYTSYGAQVANDYNRPTVLSVGSNKITNCYISNCAAPVRVKDGDLEIVNSTLKGGNFANLDIRGGHVILDNVTTINQVNGNDTAEDGTVVVGLGVVVYYENVLNTTTVEIKNGITQYNHLSKEQASEYIKDSNAQTLTNAMFSEKYSDIQYTTSGETWVNTGILSMSFEVDDDNISDVEGYVEASPSMTGVTGYLHTKKPDAASIAATAPEYATAGQGAIAPSYSFDYTTKNYVAKTDGSNNYCYEENGTVLISMDDGDTFNWDTSILTATKNGQTLAYTVSMNGTDYTGKSITFNTAGNYTVTYTYTDSNNYGVGESGAIATYSKTYTKTVHITVSVIKATTKHAEFTFGSSNQATEKITVGNNTYISATGVSHNNSTWSYITVDGAKIYYPIVEATIVDKKIAYFNVFKDIVTITDYADGGTGAAVTYDSSTTTMPSGLTVVKGKYDSFDGISSDWSTLNDTELKYLGASNVFKYAGSASASATPIIYSGALCFASPEVTNPRDEYITIVQYSYTDATNTTYYYYVGYHMEEKGDGSCVTPDTLITLADGSQVRVDSLTGNEELLVWNLETGSLDSAPIMFIDNDPEEEFEIVHLYFSDGTDVKVIYEHGFWDYDLNKYVYLDNTAEEYIGHTFAKHTDDGLTKVQLVDVIISKEVTTAWSPVTEGHLCYFVNDMLSMPGGVGGLFNIFEVDPETMSYDYEAMARDIANYGLFTYDELNAIIPLSEEMFNAAGGAYLKISIGKGNLTMDELIYMINRYSTYFE